MTEELDQARIVKALRDATTEVFSTMLGMELAAQEAYRQPSKPGPSNGVVTLTGLAGRWVGTGSICCPPELACKISAQLLLSEFASVNQEVLDAMGEVTNMIIGSSKNSLEDLVGPLALSIPMVIFGHNFTATSIHAADWVVVPFRCDSVLMEAKICLSPQPEQRIHRHVTQAHVVL